MTICDGDMDSKNVLWQDGKPLIIDLECLDLGNPYLEMLNLALSWSGSVICNIDFDCFNEFIKAYKQEMDKLSSFDTGIDLKSLYGIGFSWLDWLEYNVKRALGIEADSVEEQRMGIAEVYESLKRIRYYATIKNALLRYL